MATSRAILLAILLLRFSVNSCRATCVSESPDICYGKYPAINGDDDLDSTDDTLDFFEWDFSFVGPSELDRQCTGAVSHTYTHFFNYKSVYFMPQDTVVLDCLNCEMGVDENSNIIHQPTSRFRENGIPKQWYALNEMNFFTAFTKEAQNTGTWTKLHAAMDQINEREKRAGLYSRTMFVQVMGKLYIKDASTYAGGVYICMEDDQNPIDIKPIAYVLMPMLIPSRLEPLLSSDGKVNLGPEMRQEADHRPWHGLNFPLRLPAENATDFVGDQAIYELNPYGLYLQNEWSEWSDCTACAPFRGKQLREAHCYLRRKGHDAIQTIGKSTGYSPDLSFLVGLQEMLDRPPFSTDGVRCWSLPLLLAARKAAAADSPFCKLLPHETVETRETLESQPWLQRCMAWFYAMFAFDGQSKKTAPFYGHHFEKIPEDFEKRTKFENDFQGILADTKFFPACGSAGYFIDMRNCVKSNCSNVNYQF